MLNPVKRFLAKASQKKYKPEIPYTHDHNNWLIVGVEILLLGSSLQTLSQETNSFSNFTQDTLTSYEVLIWAGIPLVMALLFPSFMMWRHPYAKYVIHKNRVITWGYRAYGMAKESIPQTKFLESDAVIMIRKERGRYNAYTYRIELWSSSMRRPLFLTRHLTPEAAWKFSNYLLPQLEISQNLLIDTEILEDFKSYLPRGL